MAPGKPNTNTQLARKPPSVLTVAEQKKKIDYMIQFRLQQAPKLLGEADLRELQHAMVGVQQRVDQLANLQHYNSEDFQEMTNIYAEQFDLMNREYKQLIKRVEKSTKDDLELNRLAMVVVMMMLMETAALMMEGWVA
ncbi:unnamed protein product [Ambrosiozyma monospora]|uniref:Unnamed protein product n=1 Tax=Ambrosiozyma monospora TaxID=43982 RepID=A0A9W6SWP8_AMBMO|nr:unnamed protein product [Ambrosiozyma monospora]